MLDAAYRVLVCGTRAEGEPIGGSSGRADPRLDVAVCHDRGRVLPVLEQAIREERPFEAVLMGSWGPDGAVAPLLAAILVADPHLCIVLRTSRFSLPDTASEARILHLSCDTDAASVLRVTIALARGYRDRLALATTRSELVATRRAHRTVSSEFQRQNKRLQEQDEQLREQNQLFDVALNNMPQGLSMFDAAAQLVVCNARYIEMYGMSAQVIKAGCSLRELVEHRKAIGTFGGDVETYCEELLAQIAEEGVGYHVVESGDGRTIAIVYRRMAGGGWVATHEDITERTKAEAQIRHMARHDALTDLPNRVAFREQIEQALDGVARGDRHAVLCLDLDRFKGVNDTLGHPIGDCLLTAVTHRLQSCVRNGDIVARLGGDEFAILHAGIDRPDDAAGLAQRLIDSISEPYDIDGHQLIIGTSIGIALVPQDGTSHDEILRNADMALYRAKAEGRAGYRFFEPEMDEQVQARHRLELDLRKALAQGEFDLFYQPLINIETEEVTGCEALLRWRHPQRGLVPPADFIPLAEEIGLIVPLGEWVLRQACAEVASWPGGIKLAVNVSPAQFTSRNLVQTVVSALAHSGLAPSRLELEITESVLLHENQAVLATLHQLRELGIGISMDDFGTGYSSFSYLRSFPFEKIKIDRSFILGLSDQGDCAAILKAVAGLGRGLGITTTAEGVETQAQFDQVRAEGCTEVQGYLFSAPKPAPAIRQFIAEHSMRRRAA